MLGEYLSLDLADGIIPTHILTAEDLGACGDLV
jgi:hypothetical protein